MCSILSNFHSFVILDSKASNLTSAKKIIQSTQKNDSSKKIQLRSNAHFTEFFVVTQTKRVKEKEEGALKIFNLSWN